MKKLYTLLAVAALGSLIAVDARTRTEAEIIDAAKSALIKEVPDGARLAASPAPLKHIYSTEAVEVLGFNDADGFAIVAKDDRLPAVLAVGDSRFSGKANPGLAWWLDAIEELSAESVSRNLSPRTVPAPDPSRFPTRVDALVPSRWDQESPYWNKCPTKGSSRCLTGCVATAIAQVFYTNKYPTTGFGSRTNTSASTVTANFGETTYQYDLMLDRYEYNNWTSEQADAVATLMLHCGVAVNMGYGTSWEGGSGAYSDQAAEGIRQYFGVETAHLVERDYFSDAEWMEMLYTQVAGGHAMYYSGVDRSGGGGHAFVCDGYDEQGRVHINWGWSGSDDGFFSIDLLNPTGYAFSRYQDMILGMYDPDDSRNFGELVVDTVNVETPGTLASLVCDTMYQHLSGFKFSGTLNAEDIAFVRELAQSDTLFISNLDFSDAALVDNALPDSAFIATGLRVVILPRQLETVGAYAFNGCEKLIRLCSYTYDVPATGKKCFEGVKSTNLSVSIIAGSTDNYLRNAQWKVICNENNVHEFGTCIKARTVNRKYGTPNPVFGYQIIGERVTGSPKLSCEATTSSPAGKYVITIEPGTITATNNVVYANGYLQVQKVSLMITACDTIREFGQENPVFTFTYDGFVLDDTEDDLTVKPTGICEATVDSPTGEYVITPAGAESPNYNIRYTAGTLTVTEATGLTTIAAVMGDSPEVFSVLGQRVPCSDVRALAPGIYIINGRKTVIKK
ncbi:MAG: C10 family peptidase [Bacteroidales bacterium]|nr:C10 family peptidase [Candidatus Liminaster caballi]